MHVCMPVCACVPVCGHAFVFVYKHVCSCMFCFCMNKYVREHV